MIRHLIALVILLIILAALIGYCGVAYNTAVADLGGGDLGGGIYNNEPTPTPLAGCCTCPSANCVAPNADWTCGGGCDFVRDAACVAVP